MGQHAAVDQATSTRLPHRPGGKRSRNPAALNIQSSGKVPRQISKGVPAQQQEDADSDLQRELLAVVQTSSLDLVMEFVDNNLPRFAMLQTTTSIVWIARICSSKDKHLQVENVIRRDPRFVALCEKLREFVGSMPGKTLSGVVWAIAKLGLRDDVLLRRVGERAAKHIGIFKPSHFMKLCWGFARVRHNHKAMLSQVAASLLLALDKLTAVDICNILWAFTEFGLVEANHGIFCKALERLLTLLQQNDREVNDALQRREPIPSAVVHTSDLMGLLVAIVSWSDSLKTSLVDRLLSATVMHARCHKSLLRAGDLCGLLWVLAHTERWSDAAEILEQCGHCLEQNMNEASLGLVAAGFWGLGVLRVRGNVDVTPAMGGATALAEHARRKLSDETDLSRLVGMLWGVTSAGLGNQLFPPLSIFEVAAGSALQLVTRGAGGSDAGAGSLAEKDHTHGTALVTSELCCLLWSFAAQGLRHRPLFVAVVDRLVENIGRMPWNDFADVLWACATVDLSHSDFLVAAAERVVSERGAAHGVDFVDLVRAAWAFTGALDKLALQAAAVRALLPLQTLAGVFRSSSMADKQPPLVWPLLHQVLAVQDCLRDKSHAEWLRVCAQRAAHLERGRAAKSAGSRLRKEVRAALLTGAGGAQVAGADGATVEISRSAGGARVPVDVAVPSKKLAFDVECSALTVYDLEAGRPAPNGAAQLRRQALKREGWTLRLLPASALDSDAPAADLQNLLRDALGA